MNIVFRADASLTIGTGHVSRCLTLAESLKRRGAHITFICAAGSPAFIPRLTEVADAVIELPHLAAEVEGSSDDTWLTVPSTIDAKGTIAALDGRPVDWLVVDHYGIDANWESQLRPFVDRVMVIDDLANRRHDCDLLLDQNLRVGHHSPYSTLVPQKCQTLLGPRFALLREEFHQQARMPQRERTSVRRILVSFGGSDGANATTMALDALVQLPQTIVDVVIGLQHPNRDWILDRCKIAGWTCHVQTTEMARLIAHSDLALGAAGASSWERCFLGLPSVIVVTAENQRVIAQNLHTSRAAVSIGAMSTDSTAHIVSAVRALLKEPDMLDAMALQAKSIMTPHELVDRFIQSP